MLIHKLLGVADVVGQSVLYLLISLSVLSFGIIIERFIYFRKRKVDSDALGRELLKKLRADDIAGARTLMAADKSIEAAVMHEAINWHADGPDAVQEILQGAVRERRPSFESGLLFLGTLGNNAPFVGLFGTVLGIVTAFKELANAQAGGMGNVMGGIAEALVATAVGILVAIPAVVAFNVFQKKSMQIEDNVATLGNILIAHMKSVRGEAVEHKVSAKSHGKVRAVALENA
jgi:biopolymer transport protein ExbB/TolQ